MWTNYITAKNKKGKIEIGDWGDENILWTDKVKGYKWKGQAEYKKEKGVDACKLNEKDILLFVILIIVPMLSFLPALLRTNIM